MSMMIFETENREVVMDETGMVFVKDKNAHPLNSVLGKGWDQVMHHLKHEKWLMKEGWL